MVFAFQTAFSIYKKQEKPSDVPVFFIGENLDTAPLVLAEFNPNDLDEKQWKNLGFTEKQAATILKYKNVVGGKFISKEQFSKCYAVSPEKYDELKEYILLPENNLEAQSNNFKKFEKKQLQIPGKFNPDHFSANDWMKMGFTEKQASAIVKYKNYHGGSFQSKEKFKECFVISDENYHKLAPYLILPEKAAAISSEKKQQNTLHRFDPNDLDFNGWKNLGFTEKQAQSILKYKEKVLKGSFKNADDVKRCYVISAEKFEELKPFIQIKNASVSLNNHSPLQETTDFSKVDLNKITFRQLKEFGFEDKEAAFILSFRKKLGGFIKKEQILETYDINKELAEKLINKVFLDNSSVQRYTLTDAPEDWLKSHPYFRYSADRIIYYRVSHPDDKKIWKFIKVKLEYEAKMRLYLK